MGTFIKKQKSKQQSKPAYTSNHQLPFSTQNPAVHSILQLQRTIGNQALLRMFKAEECTPDPLPCNASESSVEHDCSRIPINHQAGEKIQTNLMMSTPGDQYEEEADTVAEQVVQKATRNSMPSHIQKDCTACESDIAFQQQLLEEENKTIQRTSGTEGTEACSATASVYTQIEQSRCGGQPMDPTTQEMMNDAFQADFSPVRIHTGQQSVKMNQQLNARAFTHRNHIYFNEQQYQPESTEGKRLLAHELTHVIQQRAVHSVLQRTGQARSQAEAIYTVEQTARLLNLSFSMVPRALEDTEIPENQKQKIRILYGRLRRLYEQLEQAGRSGGSAITPTFDTTPAANEINAGDANKSVTELYYPFSVSAPTPQQAPLELQAKFEHSRTSHITQIPSGQALVQRVACGGICIGIIVLGGLLLSGCSRSSSGAMGATRLRQAEQNFDRNNNQLNATELSKIHTALNSAVGNNTHLLVSFYDYYSNREIEKATGQQAQAWRSSGLYAQTDPLGDTIVNPTILAASFPNNRLGALLIHEYVHTKHHSNPMGFYDYEEGEAYGVEYYLAERNGDQPRTSAILGIMTNLSSIAMTSVHGALRQRFCKSYGAMKGLYQVIDTGSSTFPRSPFSTLTRDEARALTAELISVPSADFSADLNNILTWVYTNRTVVGMPITRCH